MAGSKNEELVGSGAVGIEAAVLTILTPILWGLSTYWEYDWVILVAGFSAGVILLFRRMAGEAEDPNIELIRRSLGWSSRLLDLLLIGAITAISIQISTVASFLEPVFVFTTLAVAVTLGFVLLEQIVVGRYAKTWNRVIYEETEDNRLGRLLRKSGNFGETQMSGIGNDEKPEPPLKSWKGMALAMGLFTLLFIVSLPVWFAMSLFYEGWMAAVMVVFSVLFLRDTNRYLYIGYGAASGLSELRWPLRWEFLWSAVKGVLIALMLGYELPMTL